MFKTATLLFLVGVCLVGICVTSYFYTSYNSWPNDYAIVFDAGSSGTRMYVYEWKSNLSVAKGDSFVSFFFLHIYRFNKYAV